MSTFCEGRPIGVLPSGGTTGQALTKKTNSDLDVEWNTVSGEGGTPEWGAIEGTLADQLDLQGALDDKEDAGEAASAIATHEGESDPHTGYLTPAEADAAYEPIGEVAAHEALADPHPGYLTPAEADADYAAIDHTHEGGGAAIDAWPVGSVFIAVVSTSPATLLGGGTWSAFGAGRMLVGRDSGDADFDTAEETGGAKTVTLTAAQSGLPQHTHIQDAHSHVENQNSATTGSLTGWGRETHQLTRLAPLATAPHLPSR